MTKRTSVLVGLVATLAVALLVSTTVVSQEQQQQMTPEQQEQMQRWEEYGKPGKPHALFKTYAGKWEAEGKWWMTPDAEPMISAGKAEMTPMFDGRYMMTNYEGDFMGQPFEGRGIDAYDNMRKEYLSVWFDNMGTGILYQTGKASNNGKTITYTGTHPDPGTGELKKPTKMVTHFESPDRIVMEMYENVGKSDEFKMMEIVYKRVK